MFSDLKKVHSLINAMLFTGIILAPTAIATPAVQDLANLRTVINATASTIGDPNSPNRGWGFGSGTGNGQLGTADLVNNITNTVLAVKFQIDTNKTAWLRPNNVSVTDLNSTNVTAPAAWTPTLPLSSNVALPSTMPTTTVNATTELSLPYIDYISTVPNLSASLISLGRSFHREMNRPVYEAIAGLQEAISALQSTMLQDNLINSTAVLRTLRASSSLENAQAAWGRFLNLPGRVGDSASDTSDGGVGTNAGFKERSAIDVGRDNRAAILRSLPTPPTRFFTHKELWGRDSLRSIPTKGEVRLHRSFVA